MAIGQEDERPDSGFPDGPTLVDICRALDDGLPLEGAQLAAVIRRGAKLDLETVAGTSVDPDALGLAVLGGDGRQRYANVLFEQCVGRPGRDLEELRRRTERQGRAVGVLSTSDGGVVCALGVARKIAQQWPILQNALTHAPDESRAVAVIVLSPSRSGPSFERVASAAGLSPLETRLAQSLLERETLQEAAEDIGIRRATAKTAMANATKRVNVSSAAELLGLLVSLSCPPLAPNVSEMDVARRLFGLTPAEARVAGALLQHGSIKHVAKALALKPETVRAHQRAIFAKSGVHRNRAFRRLLSEALALDTLSTVSEVLPAAPQADERLKFLFRADGRRIAVVDYGPRRAAPLFVGHGDLTGRVLPDRFVRCLQEEGYRPLVLQRPGFGLSDRANGDFAGVAADDMAFVLDALKADAGHFLMRDGGAAVGVEFARRHPGRVGLAVLQNPRQPNGVVQRGLNPLGKIQRQLRLNPDLLEPMGEMLRRQSRSDVLKGILRHVCDAVPADKALIQDHRVQELLVGDIHGLIAFSSAGFVDERKLYSDGWRPAGSGVGGRWIVFTSGVLFRDADRTPWLELPKVTFAVIEGGGTFVQYTHPGEIAALLR